MGVKDLKSKAELDDAMKEGAPIILHFWAKWCEASKQMDQIFSHLSTDFPHSHFFRVTLTNIFSLYLYQSIYICAVGYSNYINSCCAAFYMDMAIIVVSESISVRT